MSTPLRIKQVADVSGFSPATLRYYEDIGLLPASARTAAGYRLYEPGTVERLAFIARAKQLGCTLEEIAGLAAAWDTGRCGPVQDRMRELVATKIAEAQHRMGELLVFTSELQRAAARLDGHRPDGACDDGCGCLAPADDAGPGTAQAVRLTAKQAAEAPIACTLAPDDVGARLDDWRALLGHVAARYALADGVRLEFGPGVPGGELLRLAAAEQDCCRFFRFAITVDERGIALEVRAPDEAQELVDSVFGAAA